MSDGRPNLRVVRGGLAQETPAAPASAVDAIEKLEERLEGYRQRPIAESTQRAYKASWTHFAEWCTRHQRQALPASPETVALYLDDYKASLKMATLRRRVVAISQVHQAHKHESPTTQGDLLKNVMAMIRRRHGVPQRKKQPLLLTDIFAIIDAMPRRTEGARVGELTAQACRDRALLLLAFGGALRRSELVALDAEDIRWARDGIDILIRRSKTDQTGKGEWVTILRKEQPSDPSEEYNPEHCAVAALEAWQELSLIEVGPLFVYIDRHQVIRLGERLSDKAVSLVVKRWILALGLDPALYGGHSPRSGLITTAHMAGATIAEIMVTSRHTSIETLRGYIRDSNRRTNNAARKAGL